MLFLKKVYLNELIGHAREEAPDEACGILAGKNNKVDRVFQMENPERSPKSYFMDPKEQLKVMKEIRNLGLEMIAIYHSHPETEAYPSAHDVELAFYPDASYIIVSLKDKGKPSIRSFRIIEGKITEEAVEII